MKLLVLGAAAGGGLPQWNANGPLNERARAGDSKCPPQTQSSIAVSADGKQWVLFNASPDLRQQVSDNPQLHPQVGVRRHTPIAAVVLTNADVDHVAGLLTMRERQAYQLFGSARVLDALAANPIFNVVNPDFVSRHQVQLGTGFQAAGLSIELFAVPGKVALYLEQENAEGFGTAEGDTVGAAITDISSGKTVYYIPGCAAVPDGLKARLSGADMLLFDGTLFNDDEMVVTGESPKTGARMGHMSISGDQGTINAFADVPITHKIFIHMNNTNPVLADDSEERKFVEANGWRIARDGMEISV